MYKKEKTAKIKAEVMGDNFSASFSGDSSALIYAISALIVEISEERTMYALDTIKLIKTMVKEIEKIKIAEVMGDNHHYL